MGSEEEFEAALSDGAASITLTSDLAFDKQLEIDHEVSLNLNGHNIVSTLAGKASVFILVDNGNLTLSGDGSITAAGILAKAQNGGEIHINGGQYVSDINYVFLADGANATVEMNEGDVQGREGAIVAHHGGSIVVNGGMLTGIDNFAVCTNGKPENGGETIVINDGTLIGNIETAGYEACGVYMANSGTLIMNGGHIIANGGAGLVMRAGNVFINGGSIEATGDAGSTGQVADDPRPMSVSGIIYDADANYPGKAAGMSLTITDGEIVGVDHSLEFLCSEGTPNVTVEGGGFTPAYPEE